jgi:hypothetical protein
MKTPIRLLAAAAVLAGLGGGAVLAQEGPRARPDANGDQVLTRAEAMAHAEAMFARMDANSDGRLSPEDREAGRERRADAAFARMDADNNGAISRAEWDRAGEMREARRAERQERRASAGEGAQTRGERGRAFQGHRRGRMGMALMAQADRDGDRMVSRAEFLEAAAQRFARMDANGDGSVTADERAAARPQRRGLRAGAPGTDN